MRALLDDSSIVVRESAAAALASITEGVSSLLEVLKNGSVRASEAALGALVESGRGGADLSEWASQETARAAHLRRHRLTLEQRTDPSPTADYLLRLLAARDERLERWAIMALTTPDTEVAMSTVMRGIWSKDPETRSQAMEALDSLGDRSVVRDLLALLEQDPSDVNRDMRSSLRDLASDHDYWIRALAYRCLREEMTGDLARLVDAAEQDPSRLVRMAVSRWELPIMQETETLDLMQRVLALQRVPVFAGIDPEDLERIAFATSERHYEGEEMIFQQGDEGDEMIVIIRGEVTVSRREGEKTVPIRSFGAGDHVGELALLRGKPRSSDVTAGPDGVHTLVLRSPELQAILEERPEVAMAMLGTLADRLATM